MRHENETKISRERGNTLVIMLVLLAVVSAATLAGFGNLQVFDLGGSKLTKQKKNLYIAESTRALAIQIAQQYLRDNPLNSTTIAAYSDGLKAVLQAQLPPLVPAPFAVDSITAQLVGQPQSALIGSGTFRGMYAPQTIVNITYRVTSGSGEDFMANSINTTMNLAQVGLFQFMYFLDLAQINISPGQSMLIDGRVHANGDLCLSAGTELDVAKVTAAGKLMHANNWRNTLQCGLSTVRWPGDPVSTVYIASGPDVTTSKKVLLGSLSSINNFNGSCCSGSTKQWPAYSKSNWNGYALDSANGVPKLSLPIPNNNKTQVGAWGTDIFTGASNSFNLRFLVDPVHPTLDSTQLRQQKFADQSDIRIIDGVWYLKDPNNPSLWPGIPIWSDHPGRFQDSFGIAVGQQDLKDRWHWASLPKRFSYYDYDATASSLTGDSFGVISYGTLAPTVAGNWRPAHQLATGTDGGHWKLSTWKYYRDHICTYAAPPPKPYNSQDGRPAPTATLTSPATNGFYLYDVPMTCQQGATTWGRGAASALLNGTRSGFQDPHVMTWADIDSQTWPYPLTWYTNYQGNTNVHHILPMNFDVQQFQAALADTTAGELGSYFAGASRTFNGILYTTLTWPGSEDGYNPAGVPSTWPQQYTDSPGPRTSIGQQLTFPIQICSNPKALPTDVGAGDPYDSASGKTTFYIPSCSDYPNLQTGYANAIRIHSGATLDPTILTKGLSIVSNMPVYIMGDFNSSSLTTDSTVTPWVPALVAGDQVTFLSNNWSDANSLWLPLNQNLGWIPNRTATNTTYVLSTISGYAMTLEPWWASVQGAHAVPALMEDWSAVTLKYTGSIVLGYYPVYFRGSRYYYHYDWLDTTNRIPYIFATYKAGTRVLHFDPHLEIPSNQPPGAPLFYTSSLLNWKVR